MSNSKQLPKMINRINHFTLIRIILNKLFRKQGNAGKVGRALTGKKADSPGKFWERNLIFLLAFIFMICLANLITTEILIYFFLETLY
jgi:hypothetical protein